MQLICEFFQITTNLQNLFQYIYWKKSVHKWIHIVQIYVVQGSVAVLGKF